MTTTGGGRSESAWLRGPEVHESGTYCRFPVVAVFSPAVSI
jgi:hypothetical protein